MKLTFNALRTAEGDLIDLTVDFADPNQRRAMKALANNPDTLRCIVANLAHYETFADDPTLEIGDETIRLLRGMRG